MAQERRSDLGRLSLFVAIAGNIGSGKTSLTRILHERLGWDPHYELVEDNPYLVDFYSDMERWAFPMQTYFLVHRFRTHRKILASDRPSIQDRTIYEDAHIFARNLFEQGKMSSRDYDAYQTLYESLVEGLKPPHLLIYLKKSLPHLLEGIQKRGRDYEQAIPEEYLARLNRYYDDWVGSYQLGPKLVLEADSLDFVGRERDLEDTLARIQHALH